MARPRVAGRPGWSGRVGAGRQIWQSRPNIWLHRTNHLCRSKTGEAASHSGSVQVVWSPTSKAITPGQASVLASMTKLSAETGVRLRAEGLHHGTSGLRVAVSGASLPRSREVKGWGRRPDRTGYPEPLPPSSPTSRTTVTGHGAWLTQWSLTDPRSIPVNPPCPRLPTTSIDAPLAAARSTGAG